MLLLGTLGLTACEPGNYTSEHKAEITKQYKEEADSWFATNLPEAKVNSGNAYATGTDLYAAISGTYDWKNETYDYLYDYDQDIMYLSQEEDSLLQELEAFYGEVLGVKASEVDARLYTNGDTGIRIKLENDSYSRKEALGEEADGQGNAGAQPGTGTIQCDNLIPAGITGAEYAKKICEGEAVFYKVSLDVYVEEIPEYNHQIFVENPNLSILCYERPIDWNYHGVYRTVYYDTFVMSRTIHIQELEQGLYGGYYVEDRYEVDEESGEPVDVVSYENQPIEYSKKGDEMRLVIPEKGTLILFAKGGKYYDRFTNYSGETQENEFKKMEKNVSGAFFEGYDVFQASIHLPEKNVQGYTLEFMHKASDGVYTVISK